MAGQGGWPQRRDWYLKWGKASNAERLSIIWRDYRGLVVTIGLVAVGVGSWRFWNHVTAFGSWLLNHSDEVRNLMLSAGVVGAGVGVWVAFRRSQTDRRRQITESFGGAVALLGHKNRSVRLGAIYALERIARQNRDEHWPIMETLTAYVRDQAPLPRETSRTEQAEAMQDNLRADALKPWTPAADVQAALTVIGRRKVEYDPPGNFLDLSKTDLRGAVLWGAYLDEADLSHTHLEDAELQDAHPRGASLWMAHLKHADLRGSHLEGASLVMADLPTTIKDAHLHGADFSGADLRGMRITQEQLDSVKGDKTTQIPEGLSRPEHWSR